MQTESIDSGIYGDTEVAESIEQSYCSQTLGTQYSKDRNIVKRKRQNVVGMYIHVLGSLT